MKTDKFKKIASGLGTGILLTATAMNNSPIKTRMTEIDEEIKRLREERARLEAKLI